MGKRALAIAASAATAIDAEKLKTIKLREDEKRPEYQQLLDILRKIRDSNRSSGTEVAFLYTIHPSPQNKSILMYGLDPEEAFEKKSYPGDVVQGMSHADLPKYKPHVHPTYRTDSWGTWLIGRYPVLDSEGNFVAYICADIKKADVQALQNIYSDENLLEMLVQCLLGLSAALLISTRISKTLGKLKNGIDEIHAGNFNITVPVQTKDEFGDIARSLEEMAAALSERDFVKSAFARYVSQQVADSILIDGINPEIHGERRKITVLFCDVRGFTTISEKLTPEEVVQVLNIYLEKMVDIIFRHGGTLDKFLGDGLMAIFGAPLEDNYQEENALKAAIEIRIELVKLNEIVQARHGLELAIGIGINSGVAIVGNIGSSQRMEYTAIGDTVNLAARLEAKTKEVHSNILVSEYTYNAVRGAFNFEFTREGAVSVKGRSDEVVVYGIPEGTTL